MEDALYQKENIPPVFQSSATRQKISRGVYYFACGCCTKRSDKRARRFRAHTKQKRLSKVKTLRSHRTGR